MKMYVLSKMGIFFSAMFDLWVSDLLAKVKIVTFNAVRVLR